MSAVEIDALVSYIRSSWEGRALARYQTSVVDGRISSIFARSAGKSSLAVFATGSYGRGELCPYSDIDIMLFSNDREDAGSAERMLYELWDSGMTVSHSFRMPQECIAEAFGDIRTRTALLEARFVCGNPDHANLFANEVLQKLRARKRREFIAEKLREIHERHRKQGNSPFLLQPDVKEARGGLRDIHNAMWLTAVVFKTRRFEDLEGLLDREDYSRYLRAYDYLLRLRFAIHVLSRRKNDRLLFEIQEDAARLLGVRRSKKFSAVERMMRYYFLKAHAVSSISQRIFTKCSAEFSRRPFFVPVKRLSDDFSLSQRKIVAKDDLTMRKDPVKVFEAFHLYAVTVHSLSDHLLDTIRRNSARINAISRRNRRMAELFLMILRSGRIHDTLRLMHETGILDRFIPEFGAIRHLIVNDYFHSYPVDEHSLLCVCRLESLSLTGDAMSRHLAELLNRCRQRDLLYLAVLLHDIGKGRGKHHEAEGYKTIIDVTDRLLTEHESKEFVRFLVRNHLLMAETAFKQDDESEEVVATFLEKVETEERLEALYLVTYADMSSVSESFWTPWRAALLRRLYERARNRLKGLRDEEGGGGGVDSVIDDSLREFVALMPEDYRLSTARDKVRSDREVYARASASGFAMSLCDQGDGTMELTVSVKDRQGVFSGIVAALAVRRFNIIGARLFTSSNGWVLDRIRISNWRELWWNGMDELVEQELRAVLLHGKRISIGGPFRKGRGVESFISVDNERNGAHTVIEVMSPDRPGLLYDISQTFGANGANILSGKIYTEQGVANDIFIVNSAGGRLNAELIISIMGSLWEKIRD